jgi:hypothetical protein
LFTSDDERNAAKAVMQKLAQHPSELQVELNKVEATNRSIFVAGWRPWIGWVCGMALFTYYIPQYLMASILWTMTCWKTGSLVAYPITDIKDLTQLLIGMLGLATLRTTEKFGNKTK